MNRELLQAHHPYTRLLGDVGERGAATVLF